MGAILINGVTLQGDFMDADFIAPYEEATRKMQAAAEANIGRRYASAAEGYLEQCRVVDEYFDDIFGAGTAAKVFQGTEHNIMVHLEAVEQLTEWAQREKKKLNDFTNRYTQRRNAQAQRAYAQQAGAKGKRR